MSPNVRTGKFTRGEADAIFASLQKYMTDVARFAYELAPGPARSSNSSGATSKVTPSARLELTPKTGKLAKIAVTAELEEIIRRRRLARKPECNLIFHNDGDAIKDYRKCWQTACVINGLGVFFYRDCRDEAGRYLSVLDAKRVCPRCGKHCSEPEYFGRLFNDFRRTAAHEMWKAGSTVEDCMEVTGHKTQAMFKRYADLFSDEEKRQRQLEVHQRRHKWREAQQNEQENLMGKKTTIRQ